MSTLLPGDRARSNWRRRSGSKRAVQIVVLSVIVMAQGLPLLAQGGDATPVRASLVTRTPENAQALAPTVTLVSTPTPLPAARLQALDSAGNVNVRALPDIESDLLGTIAHGTLYPVLRNYYRWYELRFDLSPKGRAWVYGDLVTIEGDPAQIEVIDNLDAVVSPGGPSNNLADGGGDQTGANPRTIEIATVGADTAQGVEVVDATRLPTYTPPATQPPFVQQLEVVEAEESGGLNLPPLVPILALAGMGFAGLVISLLRR